MAERFLALIHYYAREGFARQVQSVCNEVLKKKPSEAVLVFWRAYGLLAEGSTAEALRELTSIQHAHDLELATAAAMLAAHESARVVDQDAVMDLQTRLQVEEPTASDNAALHLAAFYLYTKSKERARSLVERVLRNQPDNAQAQTLLGWIIISQQQDDEYDMLFDASELDEALANFEAVLDHDPGNLEANMGKAKLLELKKNLGGALDLLTEVTIKYQWFLPALVEKGRLLLAFGDWEQLGEVVARLLTADSSNIMALSWTALQFIVREGNNKTAAKYLNDMFTAMSKNEPKNAELFHKMARPFSRLACGDPQILQVTGLMADRAVQLKPESAVYMVELAVQKLLADDYATAEDKFNAALQLDELNLDANCGQLEAVMMAGKLDEAADHLQFLQQMFASKSSVKQQTQGEPPELLYLKGLLAWRQGDLAKGQAFLERCITGQFEKANEYHMSPELFAVLNPTRLTGIVKMLLNSLGSEPRAATEAPSPIISKCNRALDMLTKLAPALMECQMLYAKSLFLNGNLDQAMRRAMDVLRINPDEYQAHLLICSIYAQQDKAQQAMAALEQAVTANFAVRELPLYNIVNARMLLASGKLDEARKVLETAINLPGVRTTIDPKIKARMNKKFVEPSVSERATIYLMLVDVLNRLSKASDSPEAKKYLEDALREFKDTSEEVRVLVADCDMTIARGDVEGALKKLRRIPPTSPHYTKSRMAMADIYLKHRKDKAAYIKCYIDLVDKTPDYDTYCMLGEAFMQIQEPEKAVKAFESALDMSPKDSELTTKIARALVTTHDYGRAVDYYNKAIFNSRGNLDLQLELALLLVRLRQWQVATQSITKMLDRQRDGGQSVDNLSIDVECWSLMARIHKGKMDMDSYVSAQTKALELQKQLLGKLRSESPETLLEQREKAAKISYDLAEYHKRMRMFDKAMELYEDALRNCDTHAPSMLALAKLQLSNGDVESCQQLCVDLLKIEPDNEEASIMLAELLFQKEAYEAAIYHFQQLLERAPNHYGALAQLVQLLRRSGRLEDVPRYLAMAEAGSPKATQDPGYHFCKGLHNRYMNNPREALKEFNLARKDSKWGSQAILHMVEIYLNPDNDAVWEEKENTDTPESKEAVSTARSLLAQVRAQDTQSLRYKVLDCYALMASKDKNDVESALTKLLDMANQDPNNVPVLLAMATGFMMLKQTPKARNQLKRVQKIQYKPDEAEEFERSWLLLADIHIQGGKYDLAQELCQKCLKYNKSCAKAWEFMGQIMEREQAYKDAADHYESAWKHENQASAQVGYKLAFNYMKARRFVDAIDVCHKVIKAFPDYPKIRKDILEKARQGLKP